MNKLMLGLAKLGLVSCLAAFPSPIAAQTAASEDIEVVGRYGEVPDSVKTLSQVVSYADLDLGTKEGRDTLRHRINLTARYLCDRLGESNMSDPLTGSCRQNAVADAMKRVGTIEEGFAPRGTAWVPGTVWAPPYPPEWNER